jgi:hypothetical protein
VNKVIFGIVLGGVLGIFDGLSALVSAPETAPDIVGIVVGSTIKGLLAGLLIGYFSRKVDNLWAGVGFGLVVGAFLAWLVTLSTPYLWEIVVPGAIVGMIVGFATQRWGAGRRSGTEAAGALLLAALLLPAAPALAGGVDAAAAFAQMKSLAGTWTGTAAGEPGAHLEYRLTGNGSVVMETQFGGTEHEMISMYHLDGDKLVMTHYCAAGNQPRLVLDPEASGDGELVFVFAGGTNLDPAKDSHIHGAHFEIAGDGAMRQTWSSYADGKPAHDMVFDLHRGDD